MNDGPQLRLPTGMRDFAPAAAASRRRIAEPLAGVTSPHGDAEVIALGAAALAAAGLGTPTIDLGHLGLAREVLDALDLPDGAREEARLAIGKRDGSTLEEILRHARGSKPAVA